MKEEDDNEVKSDVKTEEGDVKGKGDATMQDSNAQPITEGEEDSKIMKTEETDKPANEVAKVQDSQDDANGRGSTAEDSEANKGEEDSIMIPGNPHTLLIKSLSPEISRADLEAVSWR